MMTIRIRFLVIIPAIFTLGVLSSSFVTYMVAREQLEKAAMNEMGHTVDLMAKQTELSLDMLRMSMERLAQRQMVRQTVQDPQNADLVSQTCRDFQTFVKEAKVFQSVSLISREARCLASSFQRLTGFPPLQKGVSQCPCFRAALSGASSVSQIRVGPGTGRPASVIDVPVREKEKVVAVLQAVLDLDDFNNFFVQSQQRVFGGRAFFIDPKLNTALSKVWPTPDHPENGQAAAPEIPVPPDVFRKEKGVVQYESPTGPWIAAFLKGSRTDWVLVVERPWKDVLAPTHILGKVTLGMVAVLLIAVSTAVFLLAHPMIKRFEQCAGFAGAIENHRQNRRLAIRGRDEIGKLGASLNAIAEKMEKSDSALRDAKQTYQRFFENAVEGIFVTTVEGCIETANPALARILGYDSPADIIGKNVSEFYSPQERVFLLEELQFWGIVKHFGITVRRCDGVQRRGEVYARAERDEQGRIIRIQGILNDITEQKEIEEERHRANEAQRRFIQSQMEVLRYQINPHFFFNVLNSLDIISKKHPGRVSELIGKLSHYLRATLVSSDSGLVPLQREMDMVESYLDLEKIRFEKNLLATFDIQRGIGDALVPELLVQPVVENAVKYGMITSPMPLQIAVRCRQSEDVLWLEVANTGKWVNGKNGSGRRNGLGLANIRQRMEFHYDGHHQMNIAERDGWVVVTMGIPRKEKKDGKQG